MTPEPHYSWNQPICEVCWTERNPGRIPVLNGNPDAEECSYCGRPTVAGIYVRDDPKTVAYPKLKEDWS